MTPSGASRRFLIISLLLPAALACAKKEQPAPQATPSQPPAATVPTTMPPPTTVPTPPPVWREARWGMTQSEVLKAFPGEAQRLPEPAPFAQPQEGSSLSAGASDVAIPAYEAEGSTFRVLFGFGATGLDRIHLSAAKAAAATCGDIESALTSKHAAPAQRASTGTSLRGEEITWKLPDQTIVLSCAGVPSLGFLKVTLDYLAPSPALAKN